MQRLKKQPYLNHTEARISSISSRTFITPHRVHFLDYILRIKWLTRQTRGRLKPLQVRNSCCLLASSSVSCMANQDTQVKRFLSAPTCRHDSALCKQTRSPRPLFCGGEPSTAVTVSDALTDARCESPC